MEALVENKTVNLFEDKVSDAPSPFYTNEKMSFYKNRLISVDEIVEMKNTSSDGDEHFDIFDFSSNYALTFEDEQGNTHVQISKKKPKKIGDIFYYVTNDDKLMHIAHETDKVSLKNLINLKKEKYDARTGIKYKILSLFEKKPAIPLLYLLTALMMDLSFCIYCLGLEKISWFHLSTATFGLVAPILSIIYLSYIQEKCDKEIKKVISEKKDTIFNTFI